MKPRKPHPSVRGLIRTPELWVIVIGFMLNAVWEFAHSPLYTDHGNGLAYIVRTRLHCTVGDVLILIGSFWVTSILLRARRWPANRPIAGGILFTLSGWTYTIWSEWFNIGIKGAWSYTTSMPTILGIGLTPALQWLILPPAVVVVLRRYAKNGSECLRDTVEG